jgi:4-amino-4-deoxy-L-arabinose transferase-like glycosyltransferase
MTRTSQWAVALSILAVAVRLVHINEPFVDTWSWRQSDVAAIARNYFSNGFHFGRPQIDWVGDQPGFVGTEFPILPFVAAIAYKFFGVHEWIGRIQAVILFAASLPFFFLLVRRCFDELVATWALFFYSFAPIGIMASRCFMPDIPSLAFSIIGLYFFHRWIESEPDERNRLLLFVLAATATSLSILIKLPSILIGAPLACLALQRFGLRAFGRWDLWLFGVITLLPAAIWYCHAYRISQEFYPHHFFGAGGVRIMSATWYWGILKLTAVASLTPVLVALGVIGLFAARSTMSARPFYWWLGAMAIFIAVVGYGNRHPWYQLPLVPIAAVFAGAACSGLAKKIRSRSKRIALSIAFIAVFGTMTLHYTLSFCRTSAAALRSAGLFLKQTTSPNSLIVAADIGDPTIFYYAERKGWHLIEKDAIYQGDPSDSQQAIDDVETLRRNGAEYLVFTSGTWWWLQLYPQLKTYLDQTATIFATTGEFKIYHLNPKST